MISDLRVTKSASGLPGGCCGNWTSPIWRLASGGIETTMSAKDASGARPPPNRNAGAEPACASSRPPFRHGSFPARRRRRGRETRKPSELAQPARPRATTTAAAIAREIGPGAETRLRQGRASLRPVSTVGISTRSWQSPVGFMSPRRSIGGPFGRSA